MDSFDPTNIANLLGSKLDTKTKFMVLNMLDPRPIKLIDNFDPINNTLTNDKVSALLRGELDYIVSDDFLVDNAALLLACRNEAEVFASQDGKLKEAGFGRGTDYSKDKKVRGDKFMWLTQAIDGAHSI
jgi:hypothetical protein